MAAARSFASVDRGDRLIQRRLHRTGDKNNFGKNHRECLLHLLKGRLQSKKAVLGLGLNEVDNVDDLTV